jgi:hypothetical protein
MNLKVNDKIEFRYDKQNTFKGYAVGIITEIKESKSKKDYGFIKFKIIKFFGKDYEETMNINKEYSVSHYKWDRWLTLI